MASLAGAKNGRWQKTFKYSPIPRELIRSNAIWELARILRHANVSTTATYYIKTAAGDVREAMATLEHHITQAARGKTETMTISVQEPLRNPDSIQ
jgi:replication-associated recombination protein RarA